MPQLAVQKKSIMIVAGEASGDLHAANMLKALREKQPDLEAFGMGGENMRRAGVETMIDMRELSVMGIVEVIKKYPQLRRALNQLIKIAEERRPDLLILIDFQEFNRKLAMAAHAMGIRVLFYVSPQVWVWRAHRAKTLGQHIDMMACIFPFELPYYEKAGTPARYVGHPIVDEAKPSLSIDEAKNRLLTNPIAEVVCLMPGSRRSEVANLLPEMLIAAALLAEKQPQMQFILPVADSLDFAWVSALCQQSAAYAKIRLHVSKGQAYDAANIADMVIVASGTASLEMALIGTPMVVVYKMAALSFAILSRMVDTRFVGLPNIVAEKSVVPELLQDAASGKNIALAVADLLQSPQDLQTMREELLKVKAALGEGHGSENVARLAFDMLDVNWTPEKISRLV